MNTVHALTILNVGPFATFFSVPVVTVVPLSRSPSIVWIVGRQEFLVQAAASSPSVVILDQVESVSRRRPEGAGITELQVKRTPYKL